MFPWLFFRIGYQMLLSLPGHRITARFQNLLIKCRLFPKPYYSALPIRSHGEISLSGACKSPTCPSGCLSVLCRIGQRCLLAFFKRAMRCNIMRNQCMPFRHPPGMSGIRYHRVIPVQKCFGYRLSVRRPKENTNVNLQIMKIWMQEIWTKMK